jgi:peptidoglycan/xylan/chitin deacetylase (PgdA/CDA1 family)
MGLLRKSRNYAMLSFDIEEFDVPCEYGCSISIERQIEISVEGVNKILDILAKNNVKATFFCTTNFATIAPHMIRSIIDNGHEIASHGCMHYSPQFDDLIKSKKILENIFGVSIVGYRQPRMQSSDINAAKVGYIYDASLNPTIIPYRYCNLNKPRTIYKQDDTIIIPSSVTPWFRIPLFWLSLHNLPLFLYKLLLRITFKYDGYFNTYFHPWEFVDISSFKIPYIIKHNSGESMQLRLSNIIVYLKQKKAEFVTYSQMALMYKNKL